MRENDTIENLTNIEKREGLEIHDIKSPLVLFNLGSSKYIAALRAANILSATNIDSESWNLFLDIVTDTATFLADPTELDYIQDVFLEVFYNNADDIDIVIDNEALNVSDEEYEKFYEYVVSYDEVELFKNIYVDFIYFAVSMYRKSLLEFNVNLKISNKWIAAIYKDEKNFKDKLEHFKKSFYAFWIYNGFENVKISVKRKIFGYFNIIFEVRKTV